MESTKNTQKVFINNGPGTPTKEVDYQQGDTVATVLKRAEITIGSTQTATIGKARIKNPEKHRVNPNDTIVIAGKPGNG